MATYVAEALQRTRSQVRWNYSRGNIWPGPAPVPPIEPLTETTMAALKKSLKAEPAPLSLTPPPKRSPTEFRGAHRTFNFPLVTVAGVGNAVTIVTELISLPMIVRRILLSVSMVTELEAEVLVSTCLSQVPSVAECRASRQIWPDPGGCGYLDSVFAVAAGAPFAVPMDTVISTVPFRIACTIVNTLAGPYTGNINVTVQDLDPEDLRVISVPVILTQQVFTRSMGTAPLSAPKGPALPKGLKVSVLQAGRPIYSRDIAWAAADPEIKKQFLNAQLSGVYPPTLQPIW